MTTWAAWREWPTESIENRLLTFLEEREARVASLGILDVRHSGPELIQQFVTAEPDMPLSDAWDAFFHLIGDHSLIRLDRSTEIKGSIVRSHAAEMVRVIRLLHQRFANHERSDDSATLVRDLVWTPIRRLRPRRDLDLSAHLHVPAELRGRELDATQRAIATLIDAVGDYVAPRPSYLASGFQMRAFEALVTLMLGRGAGKRGHVISAGTGAGKTHAFLFPALVAAMGRSHLGARGTTAICVYNRVRLAVNQFQEFVALLFQINKRLENPLTIGIDFGEVPHRAADFRKSPNARPQTLRRWEWDEAISSWICPWARCPQCDAALVVPRRGQAVLQCHQHGEFPYIRCYREAIAEAPPTFYIATGASLQGRLQNSAYQGVFGSTGWASPALIMFDEIHLYEGVEGIQSALLARRLRRRVESTGSSPTIVGLSATIADAARFFSEFTGIPASAIDETIPEGNELQWDGVEHFISLKSEPDEEVSPLSTVIQTSMALGHLLPQPSGTRHRIFCFTDSLDRVGRWVDRAGDAETNLALFLLRRPGVNRTDIRNPRSPLDVADPSTYPSSGPRNNCAACATECQPDATCPAFREGECWYAMDTIGTNIGLTIGVQTSRKTRGLETHDLVVATQSLEVGYDDSRVRGIVQYLAPSGPAAFTQRKGRAGRPPHSRTYVVSVLSPYRRRDEFYFRNLHLLADPTFDRIPLNYRNRVLARAHALHLILDRVAQYGQFSADDVRRDHLDGLMKAVEGRDWTGTLADIKRTLNLSDEELLAIIDDEASGTLRVLYPLLVCAVESLAPDAQYAKVHELLDGRIPSDLLSAMPSESIRLRPATGDPDDEENVDVLFGLSEGAPGNVRYRYSTAMWLPLRNVNDSTFEVGTAYGVDPTLPPAGMVDVGRLPPSFATRFGLTSPQIPLRQPSYVAFEEFTIARRRDSRYRLQSDGSVDPTPHTGQRIRDGSGSRLVRFTITNLQQAHETWTSGSLPEVFAHSLGSAFGSIETALANADRPMSVQRFALGADFGLNLENANTVEGTVGFRSDGQPVALGHVVHGDGLRFSWNGLGGYQPNGGLREEVAWIAFRERATNQITTGNVFARTKAVEAIMFCLSRELLAGRYATAWLQAFVADDPTARARVQDAFRSLFDPKERTQASFDLVISDPAARKAVEEAYQVTVGATQTWSPELENFVRDSMATSLMTVVVRGMERVLTIDLSDAVDSRADLVTDGCAAHGPAAIDVFELFSGGIGVLDLVIRTWRDHAVSFWNAAEEVAHACPVARRQALLVALGALDESAVSALAAAAQQLVNSGTQPVDVAIRTFQDEAAIAIGWPLDETDLRSLLQLFGHATDPTFELGLLYAVAVEARNLRTSTQRWPSPRELGVHLLDALRLGAFPAAHPIAQLGSNLATWINPVREGERYQRTMRSQLERRYVRSCDPACPSCLGTEGSSTPAHRALLSDYLDFLASSSTLNFGALGVEGTRAALSRLWGLGNASIRLGYDDADANEVAELVARLTTEKVSGRFSDISAAISWARVRAFSGTGYRRELGIQIGPGVVG